MSWFLKIAYGRGRGQWRDVSGPILKEISLLSISVS